MWPKTIDPSAASLLFVLDRRFDFIDLASDDVVSLCFFLRNTTSAREGFLGLLHLAVCGKPSRGMIREMKYTITIVLGSNLGLSGMKRMPMPRISAHTMPTPTTMRHEADAGAFRVPMEIQSEKKLSSCKELHVRCLTSHQDAECNEQLIRCAREIRTSVVYATKANNSYVKVPRI